MEPSASLINDYLRILSRYSATVRVPGLDLASEPIPLTDVYVETRLERESKMIAHHDEHSEQFVDEPLSHFLQRNHRPAAASAELEAHERMVVLGEPGQGKSTLLRHYALTLAAATERRHLPVLVELGRARQVGNQDRTGFSWLKARLPDVIAAVLTSKAWDFICSSISEGRTILLLDGLDELNDEAQQHVVELVGNWAADGNRIVLTSRPHAYRLYPLSGFTVYRIALLQFTEIRSLAFRVVKAIAAQLDCADWAAPLQAVLKSAQRHANILSRNPLFLSFMCLTAVRKAVENGLAAFPSTVVTLIRECLDALVAWHKRPPRRWPADLTSVRVVKILAPLALESVRTGAVTITQSDVDNLKADDREAFFKYFLNARLIERQGADFAFPLETFREYFAALAIAASPDPAAIVRPHLHADAWQRIILYVASSLADSPSSWIDLKAPAVTSVLVKALTPIESVLDKILKVWKPGIGDVEGELVSEMGSRLRAPLERWLAHSRRSAEFFISAILRHRRNLLNGCHYEHLLHRDLLLAVRCWTFGAPCARQIQFRLLSLSAAVMNAPLDFNLREHLRAMVSQARRDRIVEPDLEDLVSTVTGLGSSAMSEPLEMDGGMWPDELWYLSRFGQPKEEVTSRVKELFTHFGDDFKRRLLALTRDSERSLRLLATEQLADFASRMRKN